MEIINKPQQDLPNATAILVLGILSLVFCWCYGIPGLILGIIALVLSGKQRRLYLQNPSVYTESSYRNVNTGRICSIISICIAAFIVLVVIFFIIVWLLAVMGLAMNMGSGLMERFIDLHWEINRFDNNMILWKQ